MTELEAWFRAERATVEAALTAEVPPDAAGDVIYQAMRYSLFAGGKRLRPLLALLTGDALGQPRSASLPYACALEMVHTYSLMHDDLPCMDDDDFRRGKPTCHKVYGEAEAMLAGDALFTLAFEVFARHYAGLPAPRLANTLLDFTRALGIEGMVGGQSRDLAAEGAQVSLADLKRIHAGKTGALIRVSLTGVARLAGAEDAVPALAAYGEKLGLLFQVADDILDVEGTAADLGKTPGKDAAQQKATYPRLLGLDGAKRFLADTAAEAAALAEALPGDRARFAALAAWAAGRKS
jgi:geranylgeranyl diphosphate synthase type II